MCESVLPENHIGIRVVGFALQRFYLSPTMLDAILMLFNSLNVELRRALNCKEPVHSRFSSQKILQCDSGKYQIDGVL